MNASVCRAGFVLLVCLLALSKADAFAVTAVPAPTPIFQLGGTGNGYFGRSTGIALDASGNIYVGDLENGRVQEFDSHGNFLMQLTPAIDPLALTIAGNTLYVAGQQNGNSSNTLVEFDLTTGNFIRGWGSGTVFLSVAVDPTGNVYAVESSHGNIFKFAPDGTLLNSQFGGISGHEAVATDGSFIYATSNLPGGGQTTYPLQKYDFNGNLIAQWGTASQFSDGVGLAVDSSGNFHVSNQATHQVFTFQASGTNTLTLLNQAGAIGQGNGQFYYPYGIAADSSGNTYVADGDNSRVQILDSNLNFVTAFGNSTLYDGFNNNVVGLYTSSDGHIYVVDALEDDGAGRLSIFDNTGKLTFRRRFSDIAGLNPVVLHLQQKDSVAVGSDGSIFVYCEGNAGIEQPALMFKLDPQLNVVAYAQPTGEGGPGDFHMVIDPLGLLYVLSGLNVNVFDSSLNNTNNLQFTLSDGSTNSLAADSQGVLYEATGSAVSIIDNGQNLGGVPLPGQYLWAGPDRSLFVANEFGDTLSNYPPESNQAQSIWNLPQQPDGVYADQSRVYVSMVGSIPALHRQTITIAVYSNVFISSVTPPTGGDTGNVTLTISGRGFQQEATVSLAQGQTSIVANNVAFSPDGTSATAQFNLSGSTAGSWDLSVTNPDGSASTLPGAFTIQSAGNPLLWVELTGFGAIRGGIPETFYVTYGNAGATDAYGVPLMISGIPADASVSFSVPIEDPPHLSTNTAGLDWSQISDVYTVGSLQNAPLLLPVVPAGSSTQVGVTITLPAGSTETFDLQSLIAAPLFGTSAGDPPAGAAMAAASGQSVISNTINVLTGPGGDIVKCAGEIAQITLGFVPIIGCTTTAGVSLGNDLIALFYPDSELGQQTAKASVAASAKTVGEIALSCVTPANDIQQGAQIFVSLQDGAWNGVLALSDCNQGIQGLRAAKVHVAAGNSVDPNAKIGPQGALPPQWMPDSAPFSYSVRFTNLASASSPAQQVVVTDQIDSSKFDLSSFSFGPISFGSELVTPPAGSQSYATTVDLRPTTNLVVRVNANLNNQSGVATWTFTSIDPSTGSPPANPSLGFLPPDTGPPNGEGAVGYSVKPLSLPSGTVVSDSATIVFDQNSAISTGSWTNTIDSVPPVSSVSRLPSTGTTASFRVSWSGTDDASGVANFTIWVSDNGGPFSVWLNETTDTSDSYPGVAGHTYGFYSIAQDNAGNIEAAKTQAEASTTVNTNTGPIAKCQNVTVPTDPNVCTASNASINNGSSDPDGDTLSFSQSPSPPYNLGATPVTLTVTDSANLTATCTGTVTVVDKQPPTISSVTASPNMLWPPNNKLVAVTVSASAADNCTPSPVCKIIAIASNEPISSGDTQITGNLTANLRAQRLGSGTGRIYTLTVQCIDGSGNSSTAPVTVEVPHDQGH